MITALENDMKFMGETTHPGGQFRDIAVVGRARLQGDVTCRSFSCMGEAVVQGALQSGKTSIVGQAEVGGAADAGDFSVMGQMTCAATLRARALNCMGQLKVRGQLDAEKVRIYGQMSVAGDCNVDDFFSRGAFDITGLISVDNLVVYPHGSCRAGEVGGARLEVRRRGGVWAWLGDFLPWPRRAWLEVQSLEGDDIRLEDTVAKVVRGARVQIGRGCRIERVEYRDTYACDPSAIVGEAQKV